MRAPDESTVQLARGALRHLPAGLVAEDDIRAFDVMISTARAAQPAPLQNKSAIDPAQSAILGAVLLAAGYAREVLIQLAAERSAGMLHNLMRKLRPRRSGPVPVARSWTPEQLREVHDVVEGKLQADHGLRPENAGIVADGIVAELAMAKS
jgi:hypothetical protein